jgi:hypothetical protein
VAHVPTSIAMVASSVHPNPQPLKRCLPSGMPDIIHWSRLWTRLRNHIRHLTFPQGRRDSPVFRICGASAVSTWKLLGNSNFPFLRLTWRSGIQAAGQGNLKVTRSIGAKRSIASSIQAHPL